MNLKSIKWELPCINEVSESNFWEEEYISKKLLEIHLDNDSEMASRTSSFIDNSVAWISEILPADRFSFLLDVGCGPGLYAERFFERGYTVTGIDISENSIDHAVRSAAKNNFNINYLRMDYLEKEIEGKYDLATMIYCDYGALSPLNRGKIMQKIYSCLNPGGCFLLDVFSIKKYLNFEEGQTWDFCEGNGFWSSQPYVLLNTRHKYDNDTTLERAIVLGNDDIKTYYVWNKCFSREDLASEAEKAGFRVKEFFCDVTGGLYSEDRDTIAVLLTK